MIVQWISQWLAKETSRGLLTSIVTGFASTGLNAFGQTYLHMSTNLSTFVFYYVIGLYIGYVLDFLFAKRMFEIGNKKVFIPYSDTNARFWAMIRAMFSSSFVRYIISAMIDTLIGLTVLEISLDWLDERDLFTSFRYRNPVVAIIVSFFTFHLYANQTRFSWAYQMQVDPMFDIFMVAWFTLLLMGYIIYRQTRANKNKDIKAMNTDSLTK